MLLISLPFKVFMQYKKVKTKFERMLLRDNHHPSGFRFSLIREVDPEMLLLQRSAVVLFYGDECLDGHCLTSRLFGVIATCISILLNGRYVAVDMSTV